MDEIANKVRMTEWAKRIAECNNSGKKKAEWCEDQGISRRSYYYWQQKLRREVIGLKQNCQETETKAEKRTGLVQVPIAPAPNKSQIEKISAVLRIGNMTVEISSDATEEFMENLGRMIHNAL